MRAQPTPRDICAPLNRVGHAGQAPLLGQKVQDLIPPVLVGSDEESNRLGDVARRNLVASSTNTRGAFRADGAK